MHGTVRVARDGTSDEPSSGERPYTSSDEATREGSNVEKSRERSWRQTCWAGNGSTALSQTRVDTGVDIVALSANRGRRDL